MDAEQTAQQQKQDCIFCHIIAGNVAARKVYEDEKFVAILDINPANPGHILVLTKEHYSVMPQIPDDALSHLSFVTKALSSACLKVLGARGTTIFAANGVAAGQKASHFMMHIIPRQSNDNVGLILSEHSLPEHQYDQIKVKISKVLAEVFGTKPPKQYSESEQTSETPWEENLQKPEPPKVSKQSAQPTNKTSAPALDEIADFLSGGGNR